MLGTNEREADVYHKPRYNFVTQTMMNADDPETFLSNKPRYKFATQTMPNTYELEIHLLLKYGKVK